MGEFHFGYVLGPEILDEAAVGNDDGVLFLEVFFEFEEILEAVDLNDLIGDGEHAVGFVAAFFADDNGVEAFVLGPFENLEGAVTPDGDDALGKGHGRKMNLEEYTGDWSKIQVAR